MNPETRHGRIAWEGGVVSAALGQTRRVQVYLPPAYEAAARRRFPVLILQDGQTAFSTAGPGVAFGWGNWELDLTVDALCRARRMQEVVLVAVDASEARYAEYRGPGQARTGKRAVARKAEGMAEGEVSPFQAYVSFLRDELLPQLQRQYRLLKGPTHTGLMGASLGGLFGLAAVWAYPEVFGRVACLSGSFQVEGRHFLDRVLARDPNPPRGLRIYLDSGSLDEEGGDDGRRLTEEVVRHLRRMGWEDGRDLMHYVEEGVAGEPELVAAKLSLEKGAEARRSHHNEFYWRRRAWRALTFLYPPEGSRTPGSRRRSSPKC